ncbi:sentrin-specific protease 6-like [Trematomus bernacchii]|uniref:sentrin-specific protease 6-like n=1 Tax=Trematomus bernacchii TaxID=40690 RepID=UPI00146B73C6|nr:sentrin-specific protease 6-like [Trematomus bernacchii]
MSNRVCFVVCEPAVGGQRGDIVHLDACFGLEQSCCTTTTAVRKSWVCLVRSSGQLVPGQLHGCGVAGKEPVPGKPRRGFCICSAVDPPHPPPSIPSSSVLLETRYKLGPSWTRHVDIFSKDFLFVPITQQAHWFLVVVCFPGLEEPQHQEFTCPAAAGKPSSNDLRPQSEAPECTEQSWRRDTVLKRPCILVMDSLKLSHKETVCSLIRDYLQVEWGVRRGTPRVFLGESIRSSGCRVPQQNNCSDCGVYLLQYMESFIQNPVVHFDLPLRLENWFPQQRVRQKREEIRGLILDLHRAQKHT